MFELEDISKTFRVKGRVTQSVRGASLTMRPGETVGLLGQSGCGKTTLSRVAMKLIPADSGRIILDGEDVTAMKERSFRRYRHRVQMVFQNPYASLDPSRTLRWSLDEVYRALGAEPPDYTDLCEMFELPIDVLDRRPVMVSGGEIQRVSIMRCLAFGADYLLLDEPTSMLDVSTQATIMDLLMRSKDSDRNRSELLITHDLNLARICCDRVYIMHDGRIVDSGSTEEVFSDPGSDESKEFIMSYSDGA